VAIILGLQAIVLPLLRFGLLSATLAAIRFGVRSRWAGTAFRYCEALDAWAMADVLLIGGGIGYGARRNVAAGACWGGWLVLGRRGLDGHANACQPGAARCVALCGAVWRCHAGTPERMRLRARVASARVRPRPR
jgi:hypothetical protein